MMNKIEMSLDDIIKNSKDIKNYNRRGRGGARGSARGSPGARDKIRRTSGGPSFKRSPARPRGGPAGYAGGRSYTRSPRGGAGYRSEPYAKGDVDSMWTHDLYDSASYGGARSLGGGGSGKLLISNLDFGVSNNDIKVIVNR
uniref:Aly/REF export factor 2 n=1 Tax=Cacopsylla melanoneura TaxID=428564 RepID=A0A8D8QUS0_9HEMI